MSSRMTPDICSVTCPAARVDLAMGQAVPWSFVTSAI